MATYKTNYGSTYSGADDYTKKTGYQVSDADRALLDSSPDFARIFYNQKDAWSNGNDQEKSDANTALNDARTKYGGYTGGQTGLSTETLSATWPKMETQLNGRLQAVQDATRAQVGYQRANIERAKQEAAQQVKDNTAGYFSGLSSLNEAAANQGWNPMGGQSRTERANALSEMQGQQSKINSALRNTVAQYEASIAQLVAEGKYQEAQIAYDNMKALNDEFGNMYNRDYNNRTLAETQRQYDTGRSDQQNQNKVSLALQLYSAGVPAEQAMAAAESGNLSGLSSLYDYQPKTYSGGGGGSSGDSFDYADYLSAVDAYNNGKATARDYRILISYGAFGQDAEGAKPAAYTGTGDTGSGAPISSGGSFQTAEQVARNMQRRDAPASSVASYLRGEVDAGRISEEAANQIVASMYGE